MDGADAIQNGVEEGVARLNGECTVRRAMCWSHLIRKIEEKGKPKLKTKSYWPAIREDLVNIHLIPFPYERTFEACLELFCKRWQGTASQPLEPAFVKYIKVTWFTRRCRWGCAHKRPGLSSSNASQESQNDTLKESLAHHREHVMQMGNNLLDILHLRSKQQCPGKEHAWKDTLEVDTGDWNAYHKQCNLVESSPWIRRVLDGKTVYASEQLRKAVTDVELEARKTCEGGEGQRIEAADAARNSLLESSRQHHNELMTSIAELESSGDKGKFMSKHKKLVDVLTHLRNYHVVAHDPAATHEFVKFTCTCPQYQGKGVCKHVLYEGYEQKVFVSQRAETVIAGKRKKGRKRKNKSALMRQPPDLVEETQALEQPPVHNTRARARARPVG